MFPVTPSTPPQCGMRDDRQSLGARLWGRYVDLILQGSARTRAGKATRIQKRAILQLRDGNSSEHQTTGRTGKRPRAHGAHKESTTPREEGSTSTQRAHEHEQKKKGQTREIQETQAGTEREKIDSAPATPGHTSEPPSHTHQPTGWPLFVSCESKRRYLDVCGCSFDQVPTRPAAREPISAPRELLSSDTAEQASARGPLVSLQLPVSHALSSRFVDGPRPMLPANPPGPPPCSSLPREQMAIPSHPIPACLWSWSG